MGRKYKDGATKESATQCITRIHRELINLCGAKSPAESYSNFAAGLLVTALLAKTKRRGHWGMKIDADGR